jgi:hypothetical protein
MEKHRRFNEGMMDKECDPLKDKKKRKAPKKKKTKEELENEDLTEKDSRVEKVFYEDIQMINEKTGEVYVQKIRIVRYRTPFGDKAKSFLEEDADDLQRTLDAFNI